jgi:ADP-ribose pyrophosphatase YjhB (NUDIX family)
VGAVIVDGDRVLLVKRAHEPLKGDWSLPGGVVEIGETLDAALVREVREETSLDIVVGSVIEVLESIRRDADGCAEYHYIILDYVCHVRAGAPTAAACGSDADGVCWVGVGDLDRYRVTAAATAVIRKALASAHGPT